MSMPERTDAGSLPGDVSGRGAVAVGDRRTIGRGLAVWVVALALPLGALALLLREREMDLRWEHHPSHFWLVLSVAMVNVVLGLLASESASRRDDDRTFLVSMALLVSACFLGLHALATPGSYCTT
jgi:adenylate cyclase